MKEFVERTFAGVGKSKVRQGKKGKGKKGGNKQLRLKEKTPEEEVVRQNIAKLIEQRQKNTIKSNVVENVIKQF